MNDVKNYVGYSAIEKISSNLKGTCERVGEIDILTIDESIGQGTVRCVQLQPGIQIISLQVSLLEDTRVCIDDLLTESLQFYYCHEGNIAHHFKEKTLTHSLDQYQTAIVRSIIGYDGEVLIPKDVETDIHITLVNKNVLFDTFQKVENYFGTSLLDLLDSIDYAHQYIHLGHLNLKIAAQLRLISYDTTENKISQQLVNKGRYYIILAKQIAQFHSEKSTVKNTSGLLKKELQQITSLSEAIKENPEVQYSLKKLCLASGLSPAKLQEGFKFMFDRTVSDFIKTTRLEKAASLIVTTDLSISEIVYNIGLTSRSYFCKIFKSKYHYSPKEYRKKSV
ncbi:AraC family transcriptional regulator [uncultured Dokdonia sp.]|uniref:helix-turn-helix transcriptional regulator n=1 Tax=uncultured Dokdonia sp. TaxID=575653 RepID=UPI0026308FC8|nr:AraC family transcriptional regulator [uncultured Dokdonia sp.]